MHKKLPQQFVLRWCTDFLLDAGPRMKHLQNLTLPCSVCELNPGNQVWKIGWVKFVFLLRKIKIFNIQLLYLITGNFGSVELLKVQRSNWHQGHSLQVLHGVVLERKLGLFSLVGGREPDVVVQLAGRVNVGPRQAVHGRRRSGRQAYLLWGAVKMQTSTSS